ncbi:MAG: flagellar export chaperone FliS [Acidobacteriaceae bacterium]
MNYQQQSVAGMNGVELIVALYDGMVRFLYRAIQAIEANDVSARRVAIKRTLDILMHLQSRLRMDTGGSSAKALAEFYAAIFALCIDGSRLSSTARLKEAISCIRDVREAWHTVAHDPDALRKLRENQPRTLRMSSAAAIPPAEEAVSSSWSA